MESKNELIIEFHDVIRELTERNYVLGTLGESPLHMPLPEDDKLIKYIIAINHTFDLAHKAGRNQEPYKLPFSDKFITKKGLIEQSAIGGHGEKQYRITDTAATQ